MFKRKTMPREDIPSEILAHVHDKGWIYEIEWNCGFRKCGKLVQEDFWRKILALYAHSNFFTERIFLHCHEGIRKKINLLYKNLIMSQIFNGTVTKYYSIIQNVASTRHWQGEEKLNHSVPSSQLSYILWKALLRKLFDTRPTLYWMNSKWLLCFKSPWLRLILF